MSVVVFVFGLVISLLLEGTGILYGRQISLFIIIALPYLLFLIDRKKKLNIPQNLRIPIFAFLFLTLASSVFSQNLGVSFIYLLFYISVLLLFIYVLNNAKSLQNYITPIIFVFSIIFVFYSALLPQLIADFPFLKPGLGYQFVFPLFGSHNHLGDFLLLPIIFCFYNILSRNRTHIALNFLCIFFFLPYVIFSFSRSAYLALVLTLIFMVLELIRNRVFKFSLSGSILLIFAGLISLILIFAVVRGSGSYLSDRISYFLTEKHSLRYKSADGNRFEYLQQSISAIKEKPIFGAGPGNFAYVSKIHWKPFYNWTETSHNIFLDILVENGIPAGVIFLTIIYLLLKDSKKNVFLFLAIVMLLNFQTDYAHRIFSYYILFFVMLGMSYKNTLKGGN